MLNDSLAPIKRAAIFFGFMGVAVATLTFGAGMQTPADQSSATVAQAKIERHGSADARFAAIDPAQQRTGSAKRGIAASQQARLDNGAANAIR